MKKIIDKEITSKKIIKKIKNKFLKSNVKSIDDYIVKDCHYLIYEFMIITYSETTNSIDVAFDVSTRADLSAFFALELQKTHDFDDVKIMEVYSKSDDGIISSGSNCVEKHQANLKEKIISEFVTEQFQTHYLKTTYIGDMC